MEVDNARLNGSVISFYSTASNTILSVISEDWLIMRHAYLQNCVYCVY
ncbi:GntR family transcriptional regulator, partial [Staphylococcus aureus]